MVPNLEDRLMSLSEEDVMSIAELVSTPCTLIRRLIASVDPEGRWWF